MAEPQSRIGDVEEDVVKAKSAEDRKAAAALANLDSSGDGAEAAEVDAAAVSKAMKNLGTAASAEKKEVKKVKVDAADVALLVDELELTKPKATELLKVHDGDAVRAMRAFITVSI
ncbi:hypothetical protein F5B22DRAFT_131747 [Xylaria bambusicola]|uniref:uncharacterized protein n=1 Tax=Xylaria bambusicola TaxID=326684 RepID=UPI002008C7DE|nr:uncharacterized protein F5B22DRAFT_131747 [Xylaria bambusicola]KAI0517175.1 hypothetical protein F5B22DRAFT_131747 [Xylaria bambusicola]